MEANIKNIHNRIINLEKSNVYSTEETVIGKWIDGKPIYRKVFTGTTATFSTYASETLISFYTEKIINAYGYIIDSSNNIEHLVPSSTSKVLRRNESLIRLDTTLTELASQPYTLIVEYTKTTD